MNRSLPLYVVALAALGMLACSSSDGLNSFGFSAVDKTVDVDVGGLAGGDEIQVEDSSSTPPVVDDDLLTDTPFGGNPPSAPGTVVNNPPSDDDHDGDGIDDSEDSDDDNDGIDDEEDEISTVCTEMVVATKGVSSAQVLLNAVEVFGPSDFHNKDITLNEKVNLKDGANSLSIRLAGSPGDQILVQIYNCSEDPAVKIYETTVTRTTGSPNEGGGSF